MREHTLRTVFDVVYYFVISAALNIIQRAVTEQTVYMLGVVARVILARSVFKIGKIM